MPNHLELNVGPTPLIIFNASFQRYANLHTLIPLLCQRRVLLTSDLETLLKYSERRCDQVSQLLTILDKKGMAGINGMISCLKEDKEHLGHADLAAMLKHHYHRLSPQRFVRVPYIYIGRGHFQINSRKSVVLTLNLNLLPPSPSNGIARKTITITVKYKCVHKLRLLMPKS